MKLLALFLVPYATCALVACTLIHCTNGVPNPQTVVDLTAGAEAALCAIDAYDAALAAGKTEEQALLAMLPCGLSAVENAKVLAAHKAILATAARTRAAATKP